MQEISNASILSRWAGGYGSRLKAGTTLEIVDTPSRSRGSIRPSFSFHVPPSPIRGRRESRMRAAPAVSRARLHEEMRTRAYRFSGEHPTFPAQWFYGLLRALPGDRAFLPPSLADRSTSLTPASGCQNHTTSPYAIRAFVLRAHRVHRTPPQRS